MLHNNHVCIASRPIGIAENYGHIWFVGVSTLCKVLGWFLVVVVDCLVVAARQYVVRIGSIRSWCGVDKQSLGSCRAWWYRMPYWNLCNSDFLRENMNIPKRPHRDDILWSRWVRWRFPHQMPLKTKIYVKQFPKLPERQVMACYRGTVTCCQRGGWPEQCFRGSSSPFWPEVSLTSYGPKTYVTQ